MSRSCITHLRYVAMAAPDARRAVEFYRGIWGLAETATDSGISFLAAEGSSENFILRLREDQAKRLDVIAFGVGSEPEIDQLAHQFTTAGIRLAAEPAALGSPGGGYGFRFFDLDGRLVELSAGVATRASRVLKPRESIPRRLSHVVLNTTDIAATVNFYQHYLGLKVSDWIADRMCFMRCGQDHHILALVSAPHVALNHVAFEMLGIDEYMRGSGRLIRASCKPVWGPGRHGAGDNTFSYFVDPIGNIAEYTTELAIVDDATWQPRVYSTSDEDADQWGTAGPIDEFIPVSFNDPDKGLWLPAPV